MKKIFVNEQSGLLRAGWRILLFVLLFAALTAVGMIGVRWVLGGLKKLSLTQFSVIAVTATLAVYLARRFLDKESFVSLGLKWDRYVLPDVLSGVVNSALVMAAVFFMMLSAGLIKFEGFGWWTDGSVADPAFEWAVLPVILAVAYKLTIVAWWEELIFRGYFFQNLEDGVGLMWATIISSLVFGLTHILNPNGTILGGILIAFITPQLIYAYLKTGQLWLPIGLHLGWNFFQSSVFGFAASGQDAPSMLSQSPVGPEWLSGGEFGAEGSVLIIPVTLLSYLLIHWWVRATRQPGQRFFEFAAR